MKRLAVAVFSLLLSSVAVGADWDKILDNDIATAYIQTPAKLENVGSKYYDVTLSSFVKVDFKKPVLTNTKAVKTIQKMYYQCYSQKFAVANTNFYDAQGVLTNNLTQQLEYVDVVPDTINESALIRACSNYYLNNPKTAKDFISLNVNNAASIDDFLSKYPAMSINVQTEREMEYIRRYAKENNISFKEALERIFSK